MGCAHHAGASQLEPTLVRYVVLGGYPHRASLDRLANRRDTGLFVETQIKDHHCLAGCSGGNFSAGQRHYKAVLW